LEAGKNIASKELKEGGRALELVTSSNRSKISFSEEKLNQIASRINVAYIPDSSLISIKTYQ